LVWSIEYTHAYPIREEPDRESKPIPEGQD